MSVKFFSYPPPPAVDCKTTPWGSWSACSKKCGIGHAKRTREILQDSKNGGQPCPALKEMRTCVALSCPVKKSLFQGPTTTYRKLKGEPSRQD